MSAELDSKLFEVAENLRDKIDASEYRSYLLALMLYKYLSDKFLQQVVEISGKSLEEYDTPAKQTKLYCDLLKKKESNIIETIVDALNYYVEPDYLFNVLAQRANQSIFCVDDLKRAFQKLSTQHVQFNDLFSNINLDFEKFGINELQRSVVIGEVLKKLDDIQLFREYDINVFGDAYEYFVKHFTSTDASITGEFYTPYEVSNMMSCIVTMGQENKKPFRVYDPGSGSGSLLFNVQNYLKYPDEVIYHGKEINENANKLAKMNLLLHGIKDENMELNSTNIFDNNAFVNDEYKYDAVLINPPYNVKLSTDADILNDPKFSYYGKFTPKSRTEFAFLLHGLYHLDDNGTMAIIMPNFFLFCGGNEGDIRKKLLEDGNIHAVIGLPANIFYNTSVITTIIILKKKRHNRDVLFIDARNDFIKQKRRNILSQDSIKNIIDTYTNRETIDKYAYLATFEEIEQNDFNLTIPRYVNIYPDIIVDSQRYLKDVAEILTLSTSVKAKGFFLTYRELKYPLKIEKEQENNRGMLLKYGDIIVLRSGKKYLFYENRSDIYMLDRHPNIVFVIRAKDICPEVLFLYLETEEVSRYIFDMSGASFTTVRKDILEKLPIPEELPPMNAHKKNKPYIELFEENYYIQTSFNSLSSLQQLVQIKLIESIADNYLAKECIRLIESAREGIYWDFKFQHHSNNARLLHDIICMANNIDDRDAYIIFGVEDKTGRVVGIEHDKNRKDTTHFSNVLKSAVFFKGNVPAVDLETFTYKNHEIDVLKIKYNKDRPFYLLEDYRDKDIVVRQNAIYARESDSNTDIDKAASALAIEHLWRKRFQQ